MSKPTLDQAVRLLQLAQEKETPRDQIQAIIESGLWSDLLEANIDQVNREQLRIQLGLKPNMLPNIDWRATYRELGLEAPGVLITPGDTHWHIPVMPDVTMNHIIVTLRRLGVDCYTYVDDLDGDIKINDRDPKAGAYTVRVKRRVEADEELKNLSANALKSRAINGVTLLEYMLLWSGYYVTTKQSLDVENWTLCSGSRDSGGGVPLARWRPGRCRFYVNLTNPDDAYDVLRAREAVSL